MDLRFHLLPALLLVCVYTVTYGEGLTLNAQQRALLKRLLHRDSSAKLSSAQKTCTPYPQCTIGMPIKRNTEGMSAADVMKNLNKLKYMLAKKYASSGNSKIHAYPIRAKPKVTKKAVAKVMSQKEVAARKAMKSMTNKLIKDLAARKLLRNDALAGRKLKEQVQKDRTQTERKRKERTLQARRVKDQTQTERNREGRIHTDLAKNSKVGTRSRIQGSSLKALLAATESSTKTQIVKLLHDKKFLKILAVTAKDAGYADKGFWDWLSGAVETVTATAGDVLDTAGDIWEDVSDTAGDLLNTTGAGEILDTVGDFAGEAIDTVGDVAGDALDTVGDVAGGVIDEVGGFLNDTGVLDAAGQVGDAIGNVAGDVADSVGGFVGDVVDTVNQTDFGELASDAMDTAGGAWDAATDAVEDVVDTVEEYLNETGVLESAGSVADAAGNVLESAGETAGDVFESVSETAGEAVDFAQGVLNDTGIAGAAQQAVDTVGDLAGQAGEAAGGLLDQAGDIWDSLWRLYQMDPKIQAAVDKNPAVRKLIVSHIREKAVQRLKGLRARRLKTRD